MIYKIPEKARKERKVFQFRNWFVWANKKEEAEKKLKKHLGAKKFKKEVGK